ncbi:hypothetical protein GE09DRAFT_1105511 [Coniochaeta sp. 2T2.1]|nr:hypothetical protein GE09DRAFT_1105511 [Coniochaeta sp. 2T2.1]
MARLRILFLFVSLISLVLAAAPTFCKCTCFKNSTIIPLGPNHAAPPPAPKPTSTLSSASSLDQSSSPPTLQNRAASSSCTQCNRAACLSYNLPFCKDAEEKDVVAMCFQRDSAKDQIIVWGFILGTGGLLGWAALKRVLEKGSGNGTGVLAALQQRFGARATGRAGGFGGGVQQRRGGGGNAERERGMYSPLGTGDGAGRGSG